MTIYHNHHIIPKHMGGTDDPSNLVRLTVEEHAEAHQKLYEEYGNYKDYAAWRGLSGYMKKQEIIGFLQSEGAKKRNKEHGHPWLGDKNPSKRKVKEGTHHFQQDIGNRPADIIQRKLVSEGTHHWQSQEHKQKTGFNNQKRLENGTHKFAEKVSCPNCGKIGQAAAMKRWHFDNCSNFSSL